MAEERRVSLPPLLCLVVSLLLPKFILQTAFTSTLVEKQLCGTVRWVALKVTSPIVESIKFSIKYIIELYIVL